jgi:intracellular multiplication protein IcmV
MKKAKYSQTKRLLTIAFDVRRWSDFDRMKTFTVYLAEGFKRLFVPLRAEESETFSEALKQYSISKEALIKKQNALLRLSILMCLVAFGFLSYAMYMLMLGSWYSALLSLVVMLIALALAFRYHFWFFQMKKHKLGCTFQEWFTQGLLGGKD